MVVLSGILSRMLPSRSAEPVSDEALAVAATGGDRDALGELLRRYAADIHRLCVHVIGPTEGPDAAQLALERIISRIDRFDPARGNFRSWALTVARNTCRDRLRRRGLERAAFVRDGDERAAEASGGSPSPERLALARIDVEDMAEALAELPEGMRTAIVLFHVHEESYETIAKMLDVPKGTVMTWLFRGRRKLRAALEARETSEVVG